MPRSTVGRALARFEMPLLPQTYLSDDARAATYPDWLHFYHHHQPHIGIGRLVPADRVHNVTGNYI